MTLLGRVVVLLVLAAGLAGAEAGVGTREPSPATVERPPVPRPVTDVPGVDHLFEDGRVLVGGQPSADALRRLRERGLTAVVNLRTSREMVNPHEVAYDEVEVVRDLGLGYLQLQLGGDGHPYTPEVVRRLAEFLDRHPGQVLVHCSVGRRASYLWVAYLVRHQGVDLAAAVARGEAMAIGPSPLEGLLGQPLTLAYERPGDGA